MRGGVIVLMYVLQNKIIAWSRKREGMCEMKASVKSSPFLLINKGETVVT